MRVEELIKELSKVDVIKVSEELGVGVLTLKDIIRSLNIEDCGQRVSVARQLDGAVVAIIIDSDKVVVPSVLDNEAVKRTISRSGKCYQQTGRQSDKSIDEQEAFPATEPHRKQHYKAEIDRN